MCLGLPLATAGLALWAVAPALSLTPYAPDPVDFESPLPEAKRIEPPDGARAAHGAEPVAGANHAGAHDPVRFRTPPVVAPGRFDLVGVAGEMRPLELRVREEGRPWSEWVESSNGDPVYTGGSDLVQVRSREARPDGTLHFVNVSGDDTLANQVLNSARSAVSTAVVAALATPLAEAEPPKPSFVTRKEWGADRKCEPRAKPVRGRVRAAVVHHTVTTNSYSRQEAPGIVLAICRYHRNGNGWNDIGYNALVDRFGTLYEGRAGGLRRAVVGAHAQGYNYYTTGIASIATHTTEKPTRAAKQSLVAYLAWKLALHHKPAEGRTQVVSDGGSVNRYPAGRRVRVPRIFGHGTVNVTACPGHKLDRELASIRRKAQARIDRYVEEEDVAPPSEGGTAPG
jgi:uncharacterized protein with LGFP repeats